MTVNIGIFTCTTKDCSGDKVRLVCTLAGMFCSLALVVIAHEVRAYVNSVTCESMTSIGLEGIRAIIPIVVPFMTITFAVACAPCFFNMTCHHYQDEAPDCLQLAHTPNWTAFIMAAASAASLVLVALVAWSSGSPSTHLPSADPSACYPKQLRPIALFKWLTTWHGIAFTNSCIFASIMPYGTLHLFPLPLDFCSSLYSLFRL